MTILFLGRAEYKQLIVSVHSSTLPLSVMKQCKLWMNLRGKETCSTPIRRRFTGNATIRRQRRPFTSNADTKLEQIETLEL